MYGLTEIFAIVAGFAALIWGADRFVAGAGGLARTLNISPLIIGLVIVGFGTSAPEMLVAGVAGWEGNTSLAIGNSLGSNITNIALVLGITALFFPLTVHSNLLKREFPALFLISAFVIILFIDGELSKIDGIALLVGMIGFIIWMIYLSKQSAGKDPIEQEFEEELPAQLPAGKAILWLLVGLSVLLIGARVVVWGAVSIAQALGVSDLIIGLTIVAIGTSLPELATTMMSAKKGEHDIAVGNIIGSNMFNLLGVLGIPAVIHPTSFDSSVLTRDIPIMLFLTITLYLMAKNGKDKHGKINRYEGAGLVTAYFSYLAILYYTHHG
ncbi:MAG TPA: calcium/sodium antiporter [Gammaproteobacteria bacterium]|nr:calcium/sodium antiporter [Gammaproteobacteria bacterium]